MSQLSGEHPLNLRWADELQTGGRPHPAHKDLRWEGGPEWQTPPMYGAMRSRTGSRPRWSLPGETQGFQGLEAFDVLDPLVGIATWVPLTTAVGARASLPRSEFLSGARGNLAAPRARVVTAGGLTSHPGELLPRQRRPEPGRSFAARGCQGLQDTSFPLKDQTVPGGCCPESRWCPYPVPAALGTHGAVALLGSLG